jgi:hypothetical protein
MSAGALGAETESELLYWGIDLFNYGYYWEAHEAWEDLWLGAERGSQLRLAFKGLILLAAAGVKIREGMPGAAGKHAGRAAALLRAAAVQPDQFLVRALGISLNRLAAEVGRMSEIVPLAPISEQPQPVFPFVLGPVARSSDG